MSNSVRPHRRQPNRLPHPWDSPGNNTGVGCHFLLQCMKVKCESEVAQSCPTLCDPMDCSLPGSSVHGIFQARVLEWVATAFSVKWSSGSPSGVPGKVISITCKQLPGSLRPTDGLSSSGGWTQGALGFNGYSRWFWCDLPGGSDSKASVYNVGDLGSIPGSGSSLEKEMATHSSTLAWKIPWTEEPGVHGFAKSRTRLSDFTFTFFSFQVILVWLKDHCPREKNTNSTAEASVKSQ